MDGVNNKIINCVAFDCGNSSFRIVAGKFDGEKIHTQVIEQIGNKEIKFNGLMYWDILNIFDKLKLGLKKAYNILGPIDSIGICTWGVDFGLLSSDNQLISNPLCYRNTLGQRSLNKLTNDEKKFMFNNSGIQNNRINSIYQMLGIREDFPNHYNITDKILTIPDLLNFLFTGEKVTERTIASTTQMFNINTNKYSDDIVEHFSISKEVLLPIMPHGKVCGLLKESISKELGINVCPIISVPSHDTASAVTAIPTQEEEVLFISSGTWALIGVELEKPIINNKVFENNFANEAGVFSTITLLKNSVGMHIVQRIKKEMEEEGLSYSWGEIANIANSYKDKIKIFNPDDDRFFNPFNMSQEISSFILEGKKVSNIDYSMVLASAYHSMAHNYKKTIDEIENIIEKKKDMIYIIGGGSQNDYLNQLTANITNKIILAGPKEATSLGNIGIQLVYHNKCTNLKNIREIIDRSSKCRKFEPKTKLNHS